MIKPIRIGTPDYDLNTKNRCKSHNHWFDIIIFGRCAGCGLGEKKKLRNEVALEEEPADESLREEAETEAKEEGLKEE